MLGSALSSITFQAPLHIALRCHSLDLLQQLGPETPWGARSRGSRSIARRVCQAWSSCSTLVACTVCLVAFCFGSTGSMMLQRSSVRTLSSLAMGTGIQKGWIRVLKQALNIYLYYYFYYYIIIDNYLKMCIEIIKIR